MESESIDPVVTVLGETSDVNLSKTENDKHYFTEEDIEHIYKKSDPTVEWTEIMSGTSAEELLMSEKLELLQKMCRQDFGWGYR